MTQRSRIFKYFSSSDELSWKCCVTEASVDEMFMLKVSQVLQCLFTVKKSCHGDICRMLGAKEDFADYHC